MRRTLQVLRGFFRFFVLFLLEEATVRTPFYKRLRGGRWRPRNPKRLRQFVMTMGGAFVKFGQFFSMRSDILPPAYCRELSNLYDRVPAFPSRVARRIIEEELGAPVDEVFESFQDEAIGAASFAQGHLVTLRGEHAGKSAVVKVARPGAEEQIEVDTRLLLLLGWIIDLSSVLGQIKLVPIFRDFARWTRREVNYVQEAKNADHLHEVTEWNVRQRIPWIYWEHTTRRVLTMEYLDGLPLSRVIERVTAGDSTVDEELEAMSSSREVLARHLLHSFLLQAFSGQVFHADPHPGNLVALAENTIGFVDFGLLGRVNEESRREQALLMDAVVLENIERMFVAVLDLLDAPRGLAVTELYDEFAEEADEWLDACDNPSATADEKTLNRLVQASMSIARRVGLVMPMHTMLYFKAALTVDGVILGLAPEFDYKKELRRAMRLIRMRELERMYGPGAMIDRALSLQLLVNSLPDFLVMRVQEFEQGKKSIYRKLNLIPVVIGNAFRALGWLTFLAGVGLLLQRAQQRFGWWSEAPLLNHPVVLRLFDAVAPILYALPAIFLVLMWAARYAMSRSYQKVQRDD
jgi:predicted unusual protein kinase regulating ubiquinone biosynthesis (AarF/ABC1/UbiB family)